HIGAQFDPITGWYYYSKTIVDELSIYNRALAAPEIQAIYNAGSAGKCPPGVAPSIIAQPTNQSVFAGSSATFTVNAAGTAPLSYQWLFNGVSIAEANETSLALSNVQPVQAGNYSVRVTNTFGSITSSNALLTINAAPPCAAPSSGLVSWWRGEGNALDQVGGNNGVLLNGAGFDAGMVGQAFQFNGSNSYVEVPDSPALRLTNQLTSEGWVKRQQVDWQYDWLINKGGDWTRGALNYGVVFAPQVNNMLQFLFAGGNRGAGSVADLNWHHCAITARNGDVDPTFYLDGVPQPVTYRAGAGTINLYPSTEALHIGAQVDPISGWNYYSKAIVDELSIYNRALPAAEIQAIYNAGSAGKCTSVIPPAPHGATATAYLVNDFVVGASITDGGYGYTYTPAVRIVGGGGIGAHAVAVVSNGVVIAVNILDAGFGYTSTPDIYIAPPVIPQPTMGIEAMSLLSFTNLLVGTNYQLQYFNDHAWFNLGAEFTAASSNFTQYVPVVAESANGYRLASTPVPNQAYATAQVVNGFVVGAAVTSGGFGYGISPTVTIIGGGGSNATATATVSGGVVTGIHITSAGLGYTTVPTIVIAPPPANALWPMVTQAMELSLSDLLPYENYQVEFAPFPGSAWSEFGIPFTSPSTVSAQYINVSGNAGFFRVKHMP
ncbi:MAG: immunoglobulin domain-containing protein, partial [Verrucomicrobia bacterium]|nr:immunoglobulin domain-containing protein [Verrucomicrobiota bacterium]